MNSRRRRLLLWTPVLGWALVILTAGTFQSSIGGALPGGDKFTHILTYGVWGILLAQAFEDVGDSAHHCLLWGRRHPVWTALAAGALYGGLDEVHQFFVPHRSSSMLDAAADAAGCLVGAWLFHIMPGESAAAAGSPEPVADPTGPA